MSNRYKATLSAALVTAAILGVGPQVAAGERGNIVLETMGAYSYAGTVLSNDAGQSIHCDHGYAEYFIPKAARKLPIVMWHSSSTKSWQETFDGREGWQPIFLRRQFSVYLIDLPRQGRANWGCELPNDPATIGRDQQSFESFRFGLWPIPGEPTFFDGLQADLSNPDELLNEILRTRYPELNGPAEEQFESDAVAVLLEKVGPAILMPHSGGSRRAFWTALKSPNVKGIVAVEGSQLYPEGDAPPGGVTVPEDEFMKLTKFPILIVIGDFLEFRSNGLQSLANAQAFVEAVNSRGGTAELLYLPDEGIFGNTHFPMSDLNNVEVADLLSDFFKRTGLDAKK